MLMANQSAKYLPYLRPRHTAGPRSPKVERSLSVTEVSLVHCRVRLTPRRKAKGV